jgi:hypothetical protein
MQPKKYFLAFVCVLSFFLMALAPQDGITISSSTLQADIPNTITFSLDASSSANIEKVTLLYQSNGHSCQNGVARQAITLDPAKKIHVQWAWELTYSGTMPPGAQISWQWEIEDNAGNKLVTDLQTATVEDNAYDWQKLSEDELSVWWVDGGDVFGRRMLNIALDSLNRLEKEVGARPTRPVIVVLYPSTDAMKDVLLYEPEWTGGQALWNYGVVVIGIGPDDIEWAKESIPHELAHVVTLELMFNCSGVQTPTWLAEGLAVYLEGPAKSADVEALRTALDKNRLIPLHSLISGFSADSNKVYLDYAHSGEVVRFLIKTYGPEKMAALMATLQSGEIVETALQEVYGLSTDGIDAAWQQSWGYDVVIPTIEPTKDASKIQRTAVPTIALWTSVVQPTATPTLTPTPLPTDTSTPMPSATPRPTDTPSPLPSATAPVPTKTPRSPSLPCGSVGLIPMGLATFWVARRKRK